MHNAPIFVLAFLLTPALSTQALPKNSTLITQAGPSPVSPASPTTPEASSKEPELSIDVVGQRRRELPRSAPTYKIDRATIERQGAKNVAEVLRNLPGFAINDAGFGADIHTGTYYRGASLNQSVILLNGRPIGSNVNTYHGTTDLNSIPVDLIDRIELSSGASNILYGSEAFGGTINIITRNPKEKPETKVSAEIGSVGRRNYRVSHSGGNQKTSYQFGIENYSIDNNYAVPVGAANRDPVTGNLTNADTNTTSYYGSITDNINDRNRLTVDATKITSRRGLVYFGFPLQRDRLDHDALNIGLSWRSQLSPDNSSVLNTTIAYNQDYFNTYGPSDNFSRTGTLDSTSLNARADHTWQTSPGNFLRWGAELNNRQLDGNALSTVPSRIALNDRENRNVLNTALFAVNTWQINDQLTVDIGARQNFNSQFGSYVNPSAGARWAITPQLAVRANVAGAQRNPGLDQLYLYDTVHGWLPNPNLKPETGTTWTAGLDLALSPSSTAKVTYFGSSLSDRLGIQSGQWQNIGQVSTNGLEMTFRQQISPQWSAFANYTYTDAQIQTGVDKGLQLGLLPYSVAQIGVGYASQGWEVNLLANYNSGTRRAFFNDGTTNLDFTDSFINIDLNARVPISENIGLNFALENLADVRYEKANRIFSPGLTFRTGITATF